MQIKEFQIIDTLPALYHEPSSTVVISDLHLGLEGSMTQKGSYIPPAQLEDTLEEIEKLQKETEADKLVINGDIKTEFSTSRYKEKEEINSFLETATDNFEEVILVKGNHDTFLDSTLEERGLRFVKYHISSGVLYTHGHISLEELDIREDYHTIVIGHEHPALRLTDEIGVTEKIDCFLYGETEDRENIIVMPAFSQISKGTNINDTPSSKLLSPVLRNNTDLESLHAVGVSREAGVLDFTTIGKLQDY